MPERKIRINIIMFGKYTQTVGQPVSAMYILGCRKKMRGYEGEKANVALHGGTTRRQEQHWFIKVFEKPVSQRH